MRCKKLSGINTGICGQPRQKKSKTKMSDLGGGNIDENSYYWIKCTNLLSIEREDFGFSQAF